MRVKFFIPAVLLFLGFNSALAQQEVEACLRARAEGNHEKAIELGKTAVRKYPDNADAYYCLGASYQAVGKLNLALENMKRAEKLTSDRDKLVMIYDQLGTIYYKMNKFDQAIENYTKSLSLAKDLNIKDAQSLLLTKIAISYEEKGDTEQALKYYQEAVSGPLKDEEKSVIYTSISRIYERQGKYYLAIENLIKAIDIDERLKNQRTAMTKKIKVGSLYRKVKNYKDSEAYLKDALEIARTLKDRYWEAVAYRELGLLYRDMGYKEQAERYFGDARKIFTEVNANEEAKEVLAYLGSTSIAKSMPRNTTNTDRTTVRTSEGKETTKDTRRRTTQVKESTKRITNTDSQLLDIEECP